MATWRVASLLLLLLPAVPAAGEGRSASFNVSVRVVAPLRTRSELTIPPASFVVTSDQVALPCGSASSATCQAAALAESSRTGAPVTLTRFTDGTPPAVVER